MVIKDKKIAIIGGGPGGLTLARLLQMHGATVQVYERDTNRAVRVQGATLDLHAESGLEALRRAGLMDAFYKNYRPGADRLKILDKYAVIRLDEFAASDHPDEIHHRPEIDRGPLRNILLDSLAPGTVVWDSRFVSMQPQEKGWLIQFDNGTEVSADIVIGADGGRSGVRRYLTGIQPVYAGITAVEGNVYHAEKNAPVLYRLTAGGKLFVFGDNQSLIIGAKEDDTLSFYTGCFTDEHWAKGSGIDFNRKEEVLAWFRKAFGTWDPLWQELFAGEEVSFVPRPQYYYPTDQQWETKPDLTLIGDAAHLMPPYAGEGVNMAMQDAFELAEHVLSDAFTDTRSAIAAFEKQMLARASKATAMTLASTEMLHGADPIGNMIAMFNGEGPGDE